MKKGGYKSTGVETVVETIPLSGFSELRVTHIGSTGGEDCVDVRQWYCTQRDVEMKPCQKGFRIPCSLLPALIDALNRTQLIAKSE